jgi:hypothetical protein
MRPLIDNFQRVELRDAIMNVILVEVQNAIPKVSTTTSAEIIGPPFRGVPSPENWN